MAVGSRVGKKQGKNPDKGTGPEPGAEIALTKARAKLDKRRRQVEEALALVASLEIRSMHVPRASKPAPGKIAPAKSAPAKTAPAKSAPPKAPPRPRAGKRSTAKPTPGSATATAAPVESVGAAPRRRSVKPPSAGMRAPDR